MARLQRWALLLSACQYDIQYRNGEEHANADALSRLPMAGVPSEEEQLRDVEVHTILQLEALPITNQQLKLATEHDPLLSQVRQYIKEGWPSVVPEEFKAYLSRKQELTLQNDCIFWGSRVVIPPKLQQALLQELHQDHPGIFRVKALARSYIWWPGLDYDIEQIVKSCVPCQSVRGNPSVAPLHPWLWPGKPWQRVHIDFAGQWKNGCFLSWWMHIPNGQR